MEPAVREVVEERHPKRRIAALEMLETSGNASSYGPTAFLIEKNDKDERLQAPSHHSPALRQPGEHLLFSLSTASPERCPMLLLHRKGLTLAPSLVKRHFNQWADELTHPDCQGFAPDHRLRVNRLLKGFHLLSPVQSFSTPSPTARVVRGEAESSRSHSLRCGTFLASHISATSFSVLDVPEGPEALGAFGPDSLGGTISECHLYTSIRAERKKCGWLFSGSVVPVFAGISASLPDEAPHPSAARRQRAGGDVQAFLLFSGMASQPPRLALAVPGTE